LAPTATKRAPRLGRTHSFATIVDGLSTTVMLSENINAGVNPTGSWIGGWACPHPFNTSFFVVPCVDPPQYCGSNVCGALHTMKPPDHLNWNICNNRGTAPYPVATDYNMAAGGINNFIAGQFEGVAPYPNSGHTGGVHVALCDGSVRLLSEYISGTIWARLVTPSGSMVVRASDGLWQREANEDHYCPGMGMTQNPAPDSY
jgi:prepilin-type processing-associated H-X9-DG protein